MGGLTAEGIRPIFYLRASGLLFICVFVFKLMQESRKQSRMKQQSFSQTIKYILKGDRSLKIMLLILFADRFSFGLVMPYRSLFAATEKMATPLILGYMGAAMSFGMMIGALPFGRLADRIGRKKAMFTVKPLYYASVIMFILAPFPEFLILSSLFRGLGMAMGFLWTVAYMEMVPMNQRATWNSLIMLVTRISRIPSPIIGGLLYNTVFPAAPFWTQLAIDAGFCIHLYALVIPETLKKGLN